MNEKLLVLVVAALVALAVVGVATGVREPRRPMADLSRAPQAIRLIRELLPSSQSVRASEVRDCELRGRRLLVKNGSEAHCRIAESNSGSRRLRLRLARGRAEITVETRGERPAKVNTQLAARRGEATGEMPMPRAGGAVSVRCRSGPCTLVFDEPEPRREE